jgi:hypothetical protein
VGFAEVFLNGSKLSAADFTATNGTSIVLASGATVGDTVDVVAYATQTIANVYTQSQSDARYLQLTGGTLSGDLTGTTSTFSGDVTIADKIVHSGDTNTAIRFPAVDTVTVETDGSERLRVTSTGNVGIGTSSPSSYYSTDLVIAAPDEGGVTLVSDTTHTAYLMFADGTSGADRYRGQLSYDHNVNEMAFATNGSEAIRINSSGNVGLATSDISGFGGTYKGLDVAYKGSGLAGRTDNPTFDMRSNLFYDGSNYKYGEGSTTAGILSVGGAQLIFSNAPSGTAGATATVTERMRIDSSGNVLVGSTNTAPASNNVDGVSLRVNNSSQFSRSNDPAFAVNRKGNDGGLATFMKDGATIGSIGAVSGNPFFANATTGGFKFGTSSGSTIVDPVNETGAVEDATHDIGSSGGRWRKGYFSGTVDAGAFTDDDGKIRAIPQSGSDKTSSYTLTTGDVGNFIGIGSGGSITVPNSTFSAGDAVSIFNNTSGDRTITLSISTAYIAGTDGDVNSVTLATRGVCTILFISGTVCVLSGNVS